MTKQQQPNLEQLVSARHEVPGSLPSVACAPLAFREALRLVILLTAQMPFSPNTQSSFSTNEVLSLGFLKTHHWGKTVANEVQIGSHWGGAALSGEAVTVDFMTCVGFKKTPKHLKLKLRPGPRGRMQTSP